MVQVALTFVNPDDAKAFLDQVAETGAVLVGYGSGVCENGYDVPVESASMRRGG